MLYLINDIIMWGVGDVGVEVMGEEEKGEGVGVGKEFWPCHVW